MVAEGKTSIARIEKKSLKRVLGTSDLFGVGYGDLGSSIYYALGATALYALGATPIALLLAGFVFICTALTYAELSSTFPEPGGSATYTRYAFNDLISFVAGWGLLLDYVVTLAISAFTIPPYLTHFLKYIGLSGPSTVTEQVAWTIGIIIILLIVNVIGVKHSGRLNFLLALLTLFSQVLVVGFGILFLWNLPHVWSQLKIGIAGAAWSPSWPEFIKGTAMAMVAYTGIEAITQLAGETKNPGIVIPRAIKMTVVTLCVMYFGISTVGLSVTTPQLLGTTYLEDPVAGIVSNFPGGQFLVPWLGLIAAIILFIASNAGLIGCSRLAFSMGEFYQIPSMFYKVHSRFQTPYVSIATFALLGCLVILVSRGQMLFLADLYNIGAQIAFFSAHMALIVLRIKKPDLDRPYKAPLNIPIGKNRSLPLISVIGAFCNLSVLCIVLITKPDGRYAAIIWMIIGLISYFYYRNKKQLHFVKPVHVENIKMPEYKEMHLKNILIVINAENNIEVVQTACQLAMHHGAKLSVVYILDIPYSMPINVAMQKQEEIGELALKRARAIAEEHHLTVHSELVRTRAKESAINELVSFEHFDLVVVGLNTEEAKDKNFLEVLRKTTCRTLICRS